METNIRRAWESFVQDGHVPPQLVRDVVVQSWERSRHFNIGAAGVEAPLAGEGALHRHKVSNAALIKAAAPAVERSRFFLSDARSMLIVAAPTGVIVATEGDPRIVDAGRENHLETGGQWREEHIGTNAIGTALAESKPVQIHGHEHFCEGVQRWTCAAVPVRHPAHGNLVGVIDISGSANHFNPQSMALAVAIGQEVETALDRVLKAEHELLFRRFLMKRSMWLNEEMLVLDRFGLVVHSTDGKNLVPDDWTESGMNAAIRTEVIGNWQQELRRRCPNANIELIQEDDENLGAIVVLHRKIPQRGGRAPAIPREEQRIDLTDILGESIGMREARDKVTRLAGTGLPVLIEGETGTGKELFARALHTAGRLPHAPFVPVNCGGLARELIASELFGYQKGSFTGADEKGRAGRIEASDGGTLCLDEIGEMPLDLQPYLLRVLEDGIVYPIGSQEGRRVELSLVSMTNRSLVEETETGRFRQDLYYRIAAACLTIPPLRDRGEDAALLAEHFAINAAKRLQRPTPRLDPSLLDILIRLPWRGNVRELKNVVETMVALSRDAEVGLHDLPVKYRNPDTTGGKDAGSHGDELKQAEKAAIIACLKTCDGNYAQAARQLGIARSTLYVRMAEYGIARPSGTS